MERDAETGDTPRAEGCPAPRSLGGRTEPPQRGGSAALPPGPHSPLAPELGTEPHFSPPLAPHRPRSALQHRMLTQPRP